ncbi:MAG: N-acetylglucosamine kinase [Candidatus Humimicrobiaceae bacterium]
MNYILGVDGGGTKTVVRITDYNGNIASEIITGAGNYKSVGISAAESNITEGILKAVMQIKKEPDEVFFASSCFGLSGFDSEQDGEIFKNIIYNKKIKKLLHPHKIIICNDSRIGLAAGTDNKNAIMIICGTGSNCFGINEEGREAKANGWDFILGDEGSAYEIGIKALRSIMRAFDKRGKKTLLTHSILKDLNLENIQDLIDWCYNIPFSSERFAALTKTVCSSAELGDKISIKLLKDEAKEALISISVVAKKLKLANRQFDIVYVGSVFRCEKYFKQVLTDKLKEKFPKINFVPLKDIPVSGAIKMAIKNL